MQNFLDLLDTNPRIDISVDIVAVTDNGSPRCGLSVNGIMLYDDWLPGRLSILHQVDLMEPIRICVTLRDKIYCSERDTALKLEQISIDGFDIIPRWVNFAQYDNDHDSSIHTSYLGYNGAWCFEIPEPFYRWRHRITGQGWLLEPTAVSRDCAASLANTNDG